MCPFPVPDLDGNDIPDPYDHGNGQVRPILVGEALISGLELDPASNATRVPTNKVHDRGNETK